MAMLEILQLEACVPNIGQGLDMPQQAGQDMSQQAGTCPAHKLPYHQSNPFSLITFPIPMNWHSQWTYTHQWNDLWKMYHYIYAITNHCY